MKAQFWVSGVTSFSLWTFRMTLGNLAYPNTSVFQTVAYINWPELDNCIINVRPLKRHEKIQKEKDRSLSPLTVSTAQKVHLVTSG